MPLRRPVKAAAHCGMPPWPESTVFTIGHSTRTDADFVALLREAHVDLLVDVRSIPRSRANPQFNADAFAQTLKQAGIVYRHSSALGGLRHHHRGAPPSPNTLWRNDAFRNYADYAATDAFRTGLNELIGLTRHHSCAIMCAEAVWWRCHRRIIADHLLVEGIPVAHVMGHNKVDPATLTPGARILATGGLVYPAPSADGEHHTDTSRGLRQPATDSEMG
jgi:uncharacterized protein (DUF488 family)